MVTGTAPSGPVRWVYGAAVVLIAALAVLIHHETATDFVPAMRPSMQSSAHGAAMPGMPGMTSDSAAAMTTGSARADTEIRGAGPAHSSNDGACATSSMQHCSTASVDTMKLAAPLLGHVELAPQAYQTVPGMVPAPTIGRAPPDLSVLSQLRI
jgi:hypothetical protein